MLCVGRVVTPHFFAVLIVYQFEVDFDNKMKELDALNEVINQRSSENNLKKRERK